MGENGRLGAMEHCFPPRAGLEPDTARSAGQSFTYWATRAPCRTVEVQFQKQSAVRIIESKFKSWYILHMCMYLCVLQPFQEYFTPYVRDERKPELSAIVYT